MLFCEETKHRVPNPRIDLRLFRRKGRWFLWDGYSKVEYRITAACATEFRTGSAK